MHIHKLLGQIHRKHPHNASNLHVEKNSSHSNRKLMQLSRKDAGVPPRYSHNKEEREGIYISVHEIHGERKKEYRKIARDR